MVGWRNMRKNWSRFLDKVSIFCDFSNSAELKIFCNVPGISEGRETEDCKTKPSMKMRLLRVMYHARNIERGCCQILRKSDHISHFSSAKAFNVNGFLKRIFLDIKTSFVIRSAIIKPTFSFYPGSYPMRERFKLYMPCS